VRKQDDHLNTNGGAGATRRPPRALQALAVGACLLGALLTAGAAQAATIQVSTDDQLIAAVSSVGSGDTIVLAPGVYAPDQTLSLAKNVTLTGPAVGSPAGSVTTGAVISGAGMSGDTPDIIDVADGASVTVKNLSIRLAASGGAAIDDSGALELDNSELSQNSSFAALVVEDGATANIVNSTIAGNNNSGVDNLGTATFVNATVANNRKAGIFDEAGSSTTLTNTIVSRNGNGTKFASDCVSPVTSSQASLDGDGSCGVGIHSTSGFGQLANNGGPTLTMALLAGNAAIGAGIAASCPPTDQRDAPRSACDIGAFSFGGAPPAPASGGSASGGSSSGGTSGSSAGASTGSSSSGSLPTAPGSTGAAKTTITASQLLATGVLGTGRNKIVLTLRATVGKHAGLLAITDSADGVRIRATTLAGLSIDAKHKTATLRGQAMNLLTHRNANYVVTVSDSGRVTLTVTDASHPGKHPVHRSGKLASGKVFIA
jgi:hypothetical protein